eukprot:6211773-Prymnesium_polylepis.1
MPRIRGIFACDPSRDLAKCAKPPGVTNPPNGVSIWQEQGANTFRHARAGGTPPLDHPWHPQPRLGHRQPHAQRPPRAVDATVPNPAAAA